MVRTRVIALLGVLVLGGCAADRPNDPGTLANSDFDRRAAPWASVGTINVPGVFARWTPAGGRGGGGCIEIASEAADDGSTPGWVCELFPAPRGRAVRVTVWVRGVGVTGTPGVAVRAWSMSDGGLKAAVNAESLPPLRGDFEWTAVHLDTEVPIDAGRVDILLFLRGPGVVWFDDVSVIAPGLDGGTAAPERPDDSR